MEALNEKLSIKNLLFSKALPNYVIPAPVNGHKVFSCTDCGDKFVFEASLNDHINRKSVKITYMCRHCNQSRTFFNRCNLLFHIRTHIFKTATINVTDFKVEPLPISNLKIKIPSLTNTDSIISTIVTENSPAPQKLSVTTLSCLECKSKLSNCGTCKDRASHYMQYSNEVYSCPVCLFALPSICAVKTHLRLHLRCPPYYCPECGMQLTNKNIHYPYSHDCEGFKMMRATARLKCCGFDCHIFHPNDYRNHMKEFHMKKVYKCPFCVVACFSEDSMQTHLRTHNAETRALVFYKCELCPGKFVLQTRMEQHLKTHKVTAIYPCWPCSAVFNDVYVLLKHFKEKHNKNDNVEIALNSVLSEYEMYTKDNNKPKRVYRVVKRCDQCKRSFTYRCQYGEIHNLPNECPYKCTSTFDLDIMPERTQNNTNLTCHLCKTNISQDWNEIKKHYAALHKAHRCLDAKIVLNKSDITKYLSQCKVSDSKHVNNKTIHKKISKSKQSRRRQNVKPMNVNTDDPHGTPASVSKIGDDRYVCNICGDSFTQKLLLEKHMVSHRDPYMAYQCMECGKSFVVKPSFSKHLLLEHNISNSEEYISSKQCYNVNALMRYQISIVSSNEPLRENQCNICREEFEGPEDLEKHFRVHGMAFLMKNNSHKVNSVP